MLPLSTVNVPATAFRKVDFPEPLVPMMITHDPAATSRVTPRRERTSFGVPALNVFVTLHTSSMPAPPASLPEKLRYSQCKKHENGSDQLQVIGVQPPTQCHRDQQAKQYGSHYRPDDGHSELTRSHQRFSNDYAGQTPHHHPDSHADVRESLVLREQGSGER